MWAGDTRVFEVVAGKGDGATVEEDTGLAPRDKVGRGAHFDAGVFVAFGVGFFVADGDVAVVVFVD